MYLDFFSLWSLCEQVVTLPELAIIWNVFNSLRLLWLILFFQYYFSELDG